MSPEFHFLKSALIDEVLTDVFAESFKEVGFERVHPRRWVRNRVRLIRDVIEFRGDPYHMNLIWGLSLDFVPRMTGSTIHWHRTNKSASADLSYSPKDGSVDRTTRIWDMRGLDGEEAFRSDARRLLRWGIPKALEFFDTVTHVRQLGPLFEEKVRSKTGGWGFANLAYTPLAYAFFLAKSNREEQARIHFNIWLGGCRNQYREETVEQFVALFEEALRSPFYLA